MSVKQETLIDADVRDELKYTLRSTSSTPAGKRIGGNVPPEHSGGVEYEVEDGVYIGALREDEADMPHVNSEEVSDTRDDCVYVYVYVADMGEYKRRGGVTDDSANACLAHESELFRALSRELSLVINEVFEFPAGEVTFGRQETNDGARGVYYAMEFLIQQ